MKRLILMGGRPWVTGDKGKSFTKVLFRYFPADIKVAFCIFAQPESEWAEAKKWNKNMFDSFRGKRKTEYQTMTDKNFEEISQWADIVYIPGGNPFDLLEKLKPYKLNELWDNKVIAGSSAGADLFCEAFPFLQERRFGKGLGWVDATCIPHWRDDFNDYTDKDWDWAEAEAIKRYPELPVLTLPEGEFVEFTVK